MRQMIGTRSWALCLSTALMLGPGGSAAHPQAANPELAAGISQVEEGDLEAAVTTLKGLAARLTQDPARAKEAAQALLYLGAAYVGLERDEEARVEFRQVFASDPDLQVKARTFSVRVMRLLQEERDRVVVRKKGNALLPVLLTTAGLGAAAGITLSSKSDDSSSGSMIAPLISRFDIFPRDFAIANLTDVMFTVFVPCVQQGYSVTVDFGDGTPAYQGTGAAGSTTGTRSCGITVNHVYVRAGAFRTVFSVTAGGPAGNAMTVMHVSDFSGTWFQDRTAPQNGVYYLTQSGASITGYCAPCIPWRRDLRGEVSATLQSRGIDDWCYSLSWTQSSVTAVATVCPLYDRICFPSPVGLCLDKGQ